MPPKARISGEMIVDAAYNDSSDLSGKYVLLCVSIWWYSSNVICVSLQLFSKLSGISLKWLQFLIFDFGNLEKGFPPDATISFLPVLLYGLQQKDPKQHRR